VQLVFLATLAALALSTALGIAIAVRARRVALEAKNELLRVRQQAQHDLSEAEESKLRALSKLSHDLRTPLSTIVGWAQVLRAQNPPEQMIHGLEAIERNARAQTRIIQDLLDEKKEAQVMPESAGETGQNAAEG
jgi:signal transduction histidine kinase